MLSSQDIEICGPRGRDCIERNLTTTFNCSTTCEGIYADVQWVEKKTEEEIEEEAVETEMGEMVYEELKKLRKRLADLERNTKGEELDKEKYKMLIETETKIVKHFRFNLATDSSSFGKSQFVSIKVFFWQSKFITVF